MTGTKGFMQMETFEQIINKYKAMDKKPSITLAGLGEPLLNNNIVEMVKLATEKGFSVDLITNGVLLNDKIQEALIDSGIRGVYCSFYGISKYSVENSMKIDYEETLKNIINFSKLAKKEEINFKIFWIKTELVNESAEEVFKFWKSYDIEADIEFEPWNRGGLYKNPIFDDLNRFPLPNFNEKYWCNLMQNTDTYDCFGSQVLCCNDLFKKENKFQILNSDFQVNNLMNKMDFLESKPLICRRCQKPSRDYSWTMVNK